jgi:hypothetical protein
MVGILRDFGQYCHSFRDLISKLDVTNEDTQKLFNFCPASVGNAYRIRTDTWLYQQVMDTSAEPEVLERNDEFIILPAEGLQQILKTVLWSQLQRRIFDENSLCQHTPVFNPCLSFVMDSECRRFGCPRQHIDYQDLTQDWFNCQVRMHLLQILIYQVYIGIPIPKDYDRTIQHRRYVFFHPPFLSGWLSNEHLHRYWIHRLHETLRPAAHYLGSEASVRQGGSKVPEAKLGSETVVNWLRDILGNRELSPDSMLLTFLYEGASLLMLFDPNARNELMKAPLLDVFARCPPVYFNPEGTVYVVAELYQCLRAVNRGFISAGIIFFQ